MGNELLDALSALLGRTVTRSEIGPLIGKADRTVTRRSNHPQELRFHEIRALADKLEISVVKFLVATQLISEAELSRAVDDIEQLLSEATPYELALRLTELLGDDRTDDD